MAVLHLKSFLFIYPPVLYRYIDKTWVSIQTRLIYFYLSVNILSPFVHHFAFSSVRVV
jgi:hypothetical protein